MKANLLWIAIMVGITTAAWFSSHEVAPLLVWLSWIGGTWWGYAIAYGEMKK